MFKTLCSLLTLMVVLTGLSMAQSTDYGSITSSPKVVTGNATPTPGPGVVTATFTHDMLSIPNSLLMVGCSKNTWPGTHVTGVTVNGVPMTEVSPNIKGLAINRPTDTSFWWTTGLQAGTVTIVATSNGGGTNGYGTSCFAVDYYGKNQAAPIEAFDVDNIAPDHPSVTCTFTAQQDGDQAIIFEYSTAYNASAPVTASPFKADIVTGRYYALQMGLAHTGLLTAGVPVSETWTEVGSHTSTQWSVVVAIIRPAV